MSSLKRLRVQDWWLSNENKWPGSAQYGVSVSAKYEFATGFCYLFLNGEADNNNIQIKRSAYAWVVGLEEKYVLYELVRGYLN